MWLSCDPALSQYMVDSSAGCGGVFNPVNFNLYHYDGNNPVRYSDPTGLFDFDTNTIEEGDTLSQIAKDCNTRYGTNYTADDLQGLNSDTISDKNKIYAGNHLNLGKAEDVQKRAADYTSRATTQYSNEQVTPTSPKPKLHGDIFITGDIDLVAIFGFEASISLVFDLDNWKDSGINFGGGFASGLNVGVGVGIGYIRSELEGTMPLGVDGNLGFLPASLAVFTDDDGFAGGSISFGPGMGLSASTQKSATLSINSVMNFFNRKRK